MSDFNKDESFLAIRLEGEPTDDGRLYVTSPDLRGFHFLVEAEEDPIEAMTPTLIAFVQHALDAKMVSFQRAMTPLNFLSREIEEHGQ